MTEHESLVEAVAAAARQQHLRVGAAESLTGGQLTADLCAGAGAAQWLRGGIVAYAAEVKFAVLGVTPGPVMNAECARRMAAGAARVLDADAVVATTGVGGPDPEEGEPPGTVFVATLVRGRETCVRLDLPGGPEDVLRQTRERALELLLQAMRNAPDRVSAPPPPGTARAGGPAGSPSRATSR